MRQFSNLIATVFTMAVVFIVFPFAAMAQEAIAVAGGVDLGAFFANEVLPILLTAFVTFAGWGVSRVLKLIGVKDVEAARNYVLPYAQTVASWAETRAREMALDGRFTISTKNKAVDDGINMLLRIAPEGLAKIGWDRERIQREIEALLPVAEPDVPFAEAVRDAMAKIDTENGKPA